MKSDENSGTRLSAMIAARMDERGVSINDLAKKIDITYEHVRRVVRGVGAPSRHVLTAICDELMLPLREAEKLAMVDKIWAKYGKLLIEYMGKRPAMEPLDRVWDLLTESQQQDLTAIAQAWAKGSKVGSGRGVNQPGTAGRAVVPWGEMSD